MFPATAIVTGLLAAALLLSAVNKWRREPAMIKTMETVHVPADKVWLLGVAEATGAVGLVAGLFRWPIGVAAAIGVVVYFVGALIAHLRVGDRRLTAVLGMLILSIAALGLRLITR